MKKFIVLVSILILSSCGINKRIAILETKINSLNDSIISLQNPNYEIIEKGKGYYGKHITYVGIGAGKYNKASENVFIGNNAGSSSHKTRNSLLVGYHAGVNSNGYGNVAIGNYAGQNINGNNNTLIGKAVANQKIGNNNIVIGTHAGQKLGNFSNKLIIESSDSKSPLIYGDFKSDQLDINADLKIKGAFIIVPSSVLPENIEEGTIYYDLKTKKLKIWNGIEWDILN